MTHKRTKREPVSAIDASVKKEMAKPRMSRSARKAELDRDATRIPEPPSTTMTGRVKKILPSRRTTQPEKALITLDGADRGHRNLRIENTLTDEHGDDVRLKKRAQVEVTVTAEQKPRTVSGSEED